MEGEKMNVVSVRNVVDRAAAQGWSGASKTLRKWFHLLSGCLRPALLYRSRQGENPYDFSKPHNQRTFIAINPPQWR
jgi:hypothetical protein